MNGISGSEIIRKLIGRNRVLGGAAYVSAKIEGLGFVRSSNGAGSIIFGESDGKKVNEPQVLLRFVRLQKLKQRFR